MRQTLFFFPHWLFEGPLLIAWLVIGILILIALYQRHGSSSETWSFLPVFAIVALIIHFVLPMLEITGINPDDPTGPKILMGLAVRGYGMFLLLAIVSGVAIVWTRARQVGLTFDQVLGLAFWLLVAGIAGARAFYVIQKSDEFFVDGASFVDTVRLVVDMTKGGLVVYGSLIGVMIAGVVYLKLNRLPLARTADLVAPGLAFGLAIGRIGCLMNGCCFGGVCDAPLPSVTFPAGSAPYMQQLSDGELIGVKATANPDEQSIYPLVAGEIENQSIADQLGMQSGDEFAIEAPDNLIIRFQKENGNQAIDGMDLVGYVRSKRQGTLVLPVADLPARSLDTHPTQIYSAINAGLLGLVLWFYWTIRKSDGEVFGLMLVLYSIGRFLMELIRKDELGQFGTTLTISQWVSVGIVILGVAIFVLVRAWGSRASDPPTLAA